ncbi:hypothetical protein OHB26_03370 [Nocardia sp. NBC_01503]|uniref:hypothetical protein n=1 Tax=Nocardia sp. NBC_01503 TaxID=2975997 RepID=UPI002E7AF024|nr:hypothetical protein [Nocardia sp. NBC_01503]WTL33303.1 hypothetical protein OHB26_03370 [Nocardia sp. NBC_01503]
MHGTENTRGGVGSGGFASRASAVAPGWTADSAAHGSSLARLNSDDTDGDDDCRQWTVVAVVVDAGRVGLVPIGMVMAADLDLAADQVCDRLPAPDGIPGARYLVASPCTLEVDMRVGRVVTVPQLTWVNRMKWGEDVWVGTEWVPAEGGLRMLDPQHWRNAPRRSAGS